MKKQSLLLIALICCFFGTLSAQTTNLAYFPFTDNTPSPGTPNSYLATDGEQSGTAGLYLDGTNGSSNWEGTELTANTGSSLNALPGVAAGKDLAMINQSANGKCFVFKLSMAGYESLQVSFAARRTATGFSSTVWAYSTDGTNFSDIEGVATIPSEPKVYELMNLNLNSISAINDQANVYLKCTLDGASSDNGSYRIDNVLFKATPAGPDIYAPEVSFVEVEDATTLKVNFNEPLDATSAQTAGNYLLDGAAVTSAVMADMVVTLTVPAMTEGTEHTLTVQNVADVLGNAMAEPYTTTFTFGVDAQYHVQTIAELRAKWTDALDPDGMHFGDQECKLAGNVIITAINKSYRNQIFVQDETGAMVIDDADGLITRALEVGDEITDIYGTLTDYYGLLQFKAVANCSEAISIFNDVNPLTVTLTQLQDNEYMNSHQAELIQMNNVTFSESGVFSNGTKYSLTQDGTTAEAVWIHIYNIPSLTGTDIPSEAVNLIGVNKINYAKYYLIPRSGADLGTGVCDYLTDEDVAIYPNPTADVLRIALSNNQYQVSNVALYDQNGRMVRSQNVSGQMIDLNVADLSAGVYFVRLSDGRDSYTTKVVKR